MNQLIRLLGKIFLIMGIPFGLGMGLLMSIPPSVFPRNPEYSITSILYLAVLSGMLMGLFMALAIGLPHYLIVQKLARGNTFDLSPTQSRTLLIRSKPSTVFQLCYTAFQNHPTIQLSKNEKQFRISGRTEPSLKSVGEQLEVEIHPIKNTQSEVVITSRPINKITLVDFGKNYQNVERFVANINRLQSKKSA